MSDLFNVVLTGELLKGQSIMQAANSLSKLFKIAPLQAQQMLARAPLVIKKNLAEDTAIRFVQAMYKSGFGASVEQQKAVKTSILLHALAAQYDDDDEGAAVTRITPVLVEQTLLDESLDTALAIPASEPVQAQVFQYTNSDSTTAVQFAVSEPPATQLSAHNSDDSFAHELTESLTESHPPSVCAAQTVATPIIADDIVAEHEPAQSVIEQLVSAEAAIEAVYATQAAEFAAGLSQDDVVDTAASGDLFAPSDETTQIEVAAADETLLTGAGEEQEQEQEQDYRNELREPAVELNELVFDAAADLAPVELLEETRVLPIAEDVTARLAEAAESVAIEVPPTEESAEEILVTDLAQIQKSDSAQEIQHALEENLDATKDLEALQWVEPVAQWQTVAELAEDLAEESPVNERMGKATSVSESLSASVADAAGASAGFETKSFTTYTDFDGASFAAGEETEHPEQWNSPVDVSPALTAKLAQIAEQSKVAEDDTLTVNQADGSVSEDTDSLNGDVLLFEASDVSQIVSADWDDWHSFDEVADATAASVDPLLDFDLVEADWKNRSVNLSFSPGESLPETHFDVFDEKVAMQEELAAFLESDECDERPSSQVAPIQLAHVGTDTLTAAAEKCAHDVVDASEEQDSADFEVELSQPSERHDWQTSADTNENTHLAAEDKIQPQLVADSQSLKGETSPKTDEDISDWSYQISVQASCGFLEVTIPQGRELNIVSAASVTMGLSLHEQLQAGNGVRAWLLAKGFLLNTYEALNSAGSVGVTAVTHGMVCAIDEFPVMVQQGAYLASTDDVRLNADQSRLNPVVSACKWIHCSGAGTLWLNAQGLWEMVEVDGSFTMNSRYVMAYTQSLTLHAPPLAGLKSFLTSGGGVECRFKGRGVVWVQTDAAKAPVIWQKTG